MLLLTPRMCDTNVFMLILCVGFFSVLPTWRGSSCRVSFRRLQARLNWDGAGQAETRICPVSARILGIERKKKSTPIFYKSKISLLYVRCQSWPLELVTFVHPKCHYKHATHCLCTKIPVFERRNNCLCPRVIVETVVQKNILFHTMPKIVEASINLFSHSQLKITVKINQLQVFKTTKQCCLKNGPLS